MAAHACRLVAGCTAGLIALGAHAAAESRGKVEWSRVAQEDITFIHASLAASHAGAVDVESSEFARWLERGREQGEELAARARDYAGYFFAIQHYTTGFRDGHVYALTRDDRLPHRWPGFVIALRGERFTVLGRNESLIECDGRPADLMARDVLGTYVGLWSVPGFRPRLAPFLLVDEGNPFVPRPRTCILQTETGRRQGDLAWRDIPWDELNARIAAARGGRRGEIGIRKLGADGYWISLPTFNMSPDVVHAIRSVSATIEAQRESVRNVAIIVFDVRGNGGGASSLGDDVLRSLIGADYLAAFTPMPDAIDWRASPANLAYLRDSMVPELARTYGDASAEVQEYRHIAAGLASALERGESYYRVNTQRSPPVPRGSPPVRAKVFLLTDSACFSACLDFADVMRSWPAVIHVGAETRADSVYMEVRSQALPSGHGSMGIAMKVIRGRMRGHNQTYVPHHIWQGSMDDTAGLKTWITSLASGRKRSPP